jgi:hypothetical protein
MRWSTLFQPEKFADAIHLKQISARNYSLIHWVVILSGIKNVYHNWKFLAEVPYNTLIIEFLEEITNTRYNETDFKRLWLQ